MPDALLGSCLHYQQQAPSSHSVSLERGKNNFFSFPYILLMYFTNFYTKSN